MFTNNPEFVQRKQIFIKKKLIKKIKAPLKYLQIWFNLVTINKNVTFLPVILSKYGELNYLEIETKVALTVNNAIYIHLLKCLDYK